MKKRKAGIVIFVIVLIITAVRIKSMDSHRISGRILAENIAGPGMLRLVEQSMAGPGTKNIGYGNSCERTEASAGGTDI